MLRDLTNGEHIERIQLTEFLEWIEHQAGTVLMAVPSHPHERDKMLDEWALYRRKQQAEWLRQKLRTVTTESSRLKSGKQ